VAVDKILWGPRVCGEIKCTNEIQKFDSFNFQKSNPSKRCRTHIPEAVVVSRNQLTIFYKKSEFGGRIFQVGSCCGVCALAR